MIRILGPFYVSSRDWPLWRRSVQPLVRAAAAVALLDLLLAWAVLLLLFVKHVRVEW